jgi:hypothetical protein
MSAVRTLERQLLRNESAPRSHRGLALSLLLLIQLMVVILTIGYHHAFVVTAGVAALGAVLGLMIPGKHLSPGQHDPTDVALAPLAAAPSGRKEDV